MNTDNMLIWSVTLFRNDHICKRGVGSFLYCSTNKKINWASLELSPLKKKNYMGMGYGNYQIYQSPLDTG